MRSCRNFVLSLGLSLGFLLFAGAARASWWDSGEANAFKEFQAGTIILYSFIEGLVFSEEACGSADIYFAWDLNEEGQDSSFVMPVSACAYGAMVSDLVEFLLRHVAAPGFVILVIWYFVDHARRVYQGQNFPVTYFFKKGLILFFTATLLMPANVVFGWGGDVKDSRPVALWLVFHGVRAGMELGGMAAEAALTKTFDLMEGSEHDEIANFIAEFLLPSDRNGWDDTKFYIVLFLRLPAVVGAYMKDTADKLKEVDEQIAKLIKETPRVEASLRTTTDKVRSIALKTLAGVVGAVLGAFGAVTGNLQQLLVGGLMGFAAFMEPETQKEVAHLVTYAIKRAISDYVFCVGIGVAYYLGIIFTIVRMLIYAVGGIFKAYLMPMGEWGKQKAIAYFSNILAFILMFPLMVVIWFVALIGRAFYLMALEPTMFSFINFVSWGSALQLVILIVASLVLPMALVVSFVYLFWRTPSVLGYLIGNVFQSGFSEGARPRIPFAR